MVIEAALKGIERHVPLFDIVRDMNWGRGRIRAGCHLRMRQLSERVL